MVTFNPLSARKKNYTLGAKLDRLRGELLIMRDKVKRNQPHWRAPEKVQARYQRLCKKLHLPKEIYSLEFNTTGTKLTMNFRKNSYAVKRKRIGFGRNIIITDNHQWSTADIVESSLDRWQVEDRFRQSKDDDLVGAQPVRHWTDSKIRCHLFTCIVAMTYLRLLELKLEASGIKKTADVVMNEMRHLHSVLSFTDGRYKPLRRLESPTEGQSEVLETLGYRIDRSGVLQKVVA